MYSSSRIIRVPGLASPYVVPTQVSPIVDGRAPRGCDGDAVSAATPLGRPEAAEALESAQREAQLILERANAEADRLRQEARQAGFEEGLRAGRLAVERETAEQVSSLRQMLAAALAERQRVLASCERDLVALSLAIASHVVRERAAVDPSIVQASVRAALARVGNARDVVVKVNPQDLASIAAFRGEWSPEGGDRRVEFVADEAVERGGCLAEVEAGTVDARLESQFTETVRYFESLLASTKPPLAGG